jgi:hypothetical protein
METWTTATKTTVVVLDETKPNKMPPPMCRLWWGDEDAVKMPVVMKKAVGCVLSSTTLHRTENPHRQTGRRNCEVSNINI